MAARDEIHTSDSHEPDVCDEAMMQVFALLGKRWTGLVITVLMQRPYRFAELARAVHGISERMLADRLTQLADAGLVQREVEAGPPVGVRYKLTKSGEGLRPALEELRQWAQHSL